MAILNTDDGTEIYYEDWGGGTPVVLIHGWPLNGDMWDNQSNFLVENGFRVVTYDRRGFGRSSRPRSGYDYDTLTGDLNQLITKLDLQRIVLVGFSMGGGEVVRYLSTYGDRRVSKAVLVSAVPPFLLKTEDNPEGVDPQVFSDIEENLLKDRPAFLQEFAKKFYGRTVIHHSVSEAVLEWTQAMALTGCLRSTLATAHSWSRTDFRKEMAAIQIPVRIVQGTGDSSVPIDASGRRSAKILPNATLAEYDGEPHGLFWTSASRLNEELLDFISEAPVNRLTSQLAS